MTYTITRDYIRFGNSRSGQKINKVRFIVSHDTGNPGSTAYGNRSWFNNAQPSASAHTFIDDKYILEIIPLNEKAWHVIYNVTTDNKRFGDDANDAAIGVELCWGGKINFQEAYKRYVWYHAYLCKKFGLKPEKHIVSHKELDPGRKIDPQNALNRHGITWEQFIEDVKKEYEGGLTVSQAKELQKQIDSLNGTVNQLKKELENKVNARPQGRTPSPSHQESWKWLVQTGMSNGDRPKDYLTREQFGTLLKQYHDKFVKPHL